MRVVDRDHGYKALVTRAHDSHHVTVGIHADDGATAKNDYHGRAGRTSLVEVAAAHEFGAGVPERSFVRSWFDENESRLRVELGHAERATMAGDVGALQRVAQRWRSEMRTFLTSRAAGLRPLTDATITARAAAGINDETPLVATWQLVAAIGAMVDGKKA